MYTLFTYIVVVVRLKKKLQIDFLYIMNILLDVYTYGIYKICIIVNYVIDIMF